MDFTYTGHRVNRVRDAISSTRQFRHGVTNGIVHAMRKPDKECLITVTITAAIWLLAIVAVLV